MDSCPLAFCIWHTAVRPGRSPGRHEEQTEHPLQRRLQAEMGLVHSRESRFQVALDHPPLPVSQMLRGSRKPIGRLSYGYALRSQLWELWASVCFFFFLMIHLQWPCGDPGSQNTSREQRSSACHGSSPPGVLFL